MNEDVEQSIFCLSVITTDGQKKFTISSVKMFIHRAVVMGEPHFFGLQEGSSLLFFGISVFRPAQVGQNLLQAIGRAGIYVLAGT